LILKNWLSDDSCGNTPLGGDGFIQIGNWRFGNVDNTHFSFQHKSGNTAVIYRSDGTIHPGPRRDFGTWDRDLLPQTKNIEYGDHYIQFGPFRLGITDFNRNHLSLSHKDGKTAMIWRMDGT